MRNLSWWICRRTNCARGSPPAKFICPNAPPPRRTVFSAREICPRCANWRCVSRRNTSARMCSRNVRRTAPARRGNPASACSSPSAPARLPRRSCAGRGGWPANCTPRGWRFMSSPRALCRTKIRRGWPRIWRWRANSARKSSPRPTTTWCAAFCAPRANRTPRRSSSANRRAGA